jgi:hypothetical protein
MANTGTVELNNGLIGACPAHPILAYMIDSIRSSMAQLPIPAAPPGDPMALIGAMAGVDLKGIVGGGAAAAVPAARKEPAVAKGAAAVDPLALIGAMAGVDLKGIVGGGAATAPKATAKAISARAAMQTIERTGPGLLSRAFAAALGSQAEDLKRAGALRQERTGAEALVFAMMQPGQDQEAGFLSSDEQELVVALPTVYFQPLRNDTKQRTAGAREHPDTMAIHYHECSWQV